MINDEIKNKVLNAHIEYIVSEIRKAISNVETILLCGSYGREEGSWYIDHNNMCKPYNDYDFIVISDNPNISKEKLNELREKCADYVDIEWVDIDIYSHKKINKMNRTQKNIDIIYGSKLVYGKEIKWNTDKYKFDSLGVSDIETLYFTRMWTFWGTYSLLSYKKLNIKDSIFFKYQMCKAVFACIDVILIKNRLYNYSYKERVINIKKITKFSAYFDIFEWALNMKIEPSANEMSDKDVIQLYDKVMQLYRLAMEYAFGSKFVFYKNKVLFELYYRIKPKNLILLLYRMLKGKFEYNQKFIRVMMLQNSLFIDLSNKSNIDINYYRKKIERITKTTFAGESIQSIVNTVAVVRNSL